MCAHRDVNKIILTFMCTHERINRIAHSSMCIHKNMNHDRLHQIKAK